MAENLGHNDPYRNMKRSDIRPGFLGGKSGERDGRRDNAAEDLKGAEENAAGSMGGGDGEGAGGASRMGLPGVAAGEKNAGGVFTGVGKAKDDKKGGKAKGFLKRKGPMALIFGLIGGAGGMMMGAQSLMPMAIEEMIIEKFNSIGISSTMASDSWLDTQLNQGVRLEKIDTGETANLFAFSEHQVQSFEKQGIKVCDSIGGLRVTRITALLYKKDGVWVPVVGSDMLKYNDYTEAQLISAIENGCGYNNVGKPISAATALADPVFKNPYTTASKTWRGGSSGWFDKIMSSVTELKLGIRRNRWARWATGVMKDATKAFKETADGVNLGKTTDSGLSRDKEVPVYGENEDGEMVQVGTKRENIDEVSVLDENGNQVSNDNVTNTSINGNKTIEGVNKVLNSKAIKAAAAIADYGCAVLEGLMSVYSVLSAYQGLQFLNLTSGFLEAVDKVKSGDGNGSPINEYSNNLTVKAKTTRDDGSVVSDDKTAMQSVGMSWLFGGNKINQNDDSVRNVNFETVMSDANILFDNFTTTAQVYENCGYVKAGVAATNLLTTVISFIPLFGQAVKAVQVTVKEVTKIAIKAAVQIALYAIIPIAAKNLTNMLIKNAATEWFGEDLGNAIIAGAGQYLGKNGTSATQSPASLNNVVSYLVERDAVIAEEAKYQRSIRSPFDITSRYTFLGSLVFALIPSAYSANGVVPMLASASRLVSSFMVGMLPTAIAVSENDEISSMGDCPLLESTGAVGDAYCNPYIITDTSTIKESPIEIDNIVHQIDDNNFNEDGTINSGSNLAKFIVYCGQRTSQYGIKDAAISEKISGGGGSIINYIPLVNDVANIVEGISDEVNLAWANGSACVASEENNYWESEYKYYQRYAENERELENMNPGYTSRVSALMQEYYEANPVDDSFEGQLARFSGMSKEDVEDTLALIEYYDYVAEYDTSERYAFGAPVVKKDDSIQFESENLMAGAYILFDNIIYADVRNRTNLV